jgi:hypothetical protein
MLEEHESHSLRLESERDNDMWDLKIGHNLAAAALIAAVGTTGCNTDTEPGQAELGEVPEVAEVDAEPTPRGELELEEALPLTEEDIGDELLVTGTVTGTVIPDGFFVATEHGRVLFVESAERVMPGELVTVTGPVRSATVPVFEEWEVQALQGEVEAEWELLRTYYIEGQSVATP